MGMALRDPEELSTLEYLNDKMSDTLYIDHNELASSQYSDDKYSG